MSNCTTPRWQSWYASTWCLVFCMLTTVPYSKGLPSASPRPHHPFQFLHSPSLSSSFLALISFLSFLLFLLPSFFLSPFFLVLFFLSSSFPSTFIFNRPFYCFTYFVIFFSLDKPGQTMDHYRTVGLSSRAQTFLLTREQYSLSVVSQFL